MTHWHPVLAAVEQTPGVWILTAQSGPYAVVRLLEVGHERGYRATTYTEPRQLIGYFTNLAAACSAAHRAYVRAHGPTLDPATIYPDLTGRNQNEVNTH